MSSAEIAIAMSAPKVKAMTRECAAACSSTALSVEAEKCRSVTARPSRVT